MEIRGFKAFDKEMKNRYGQSFLEKEIYTISGDLKFGNEGNGLHFCKRMEDTLRYVPGMEEEIQIASVISKETIVEYYDDYYGYYDMYAAQCLFVEHIYSRLEIISYMLKSHPYSVQRFLSGYRLTENEIELFQNAFSTQQSILNTISYYQLNNKDVFSLERKSLVKSKK